jgi:hypothetical protein
MKTKKLLCILAMGWLISNSSFANCDFRWQYGTGWSDWHTSYHYSCNDLIGMTVYPGGVKLSNNPPNFQCCDWIGNDYVGLGVNCPLGPSAPPPGHYPVYEPGQGGGGAKSIPYPIKGLDNIKGYMLFLNDKGFLEYRDSKSKFGINLDYLGEGAKVLIHGNYTPDGKSIEITVCKIDEANKVIDFTKATKFTYNLDDINLNWNNQYEKFVLKSDKTFLTNNNDYLKLTFNDISIIDKQKFTLRIYDLKGVLIAESFLTNENDFKLSTAGFSSGLYKYILYSDGDRIKTGGFIK